VTSLIKKCPVCKSYTMKEECDRCGVKTHVAHPVKYSPDDKYRLYKARIGREYLSLLLAGNQGKTLTEELRNEDR